ncbi:MAG: translation initiation factor IF-2 [Candidatus Eutrophobiaceae bacterium]
MPQEMTVRQFAEKKKMSLDRLLEQLEQAGISGKAADDPIDSEEKHILLGFLTSKRNSSASALGKVTITRRTQSEIKVPVSKTGYAKPRTKSVTIEKRQRRTYVKRSELEEEQRKRKEEEEEKLRREEELKAKQEALKKEHAVSVEAAAQEEPQEMPQEEPQEMQEIRVAAEQNSPDGEAQEEHSVAKEDVPVAVVVDADAKKQEKEKEKEQAGGRKEKTQTRKNAGREEREVGSMAKGKDGGRENGNFSERGELHVSGDMSGRRRPKRQRKRRHTMPQASTQHGFNKPVDPIVREVEIPESISVGELARRMTVKASEVIKKLMELGTMATINQIIDQDAAAIIVEEMKHKVKRVREDDIEGELRPSLGEEQGECIPRSPVIAVMGHVDHGKTTLLDYIRKAKVAAGEVGGITQHIGAYMVHLERGALTFLDTPGHEAFTAMRARGAKATDIVVVVVSAEDGVMPQTEESLKHAQQSEAPIVIAVNKMDKEGADPERIRQELARIGITAEDWGGDTQFVNISAKTGEGIDALLEAILLQAEILELKVAKDCLASGTVLEASLDRQRGPLATILVQQGTLKKGDMILTGQQWGRVRAMMNHLGQSVMEATPSMPVEVMGLSGTPVAGDEMNVVIEEKKARELADLRQAKAREKDLSRSPADAAEIIFEGVKKPGASVSLIIKADVQGSMEALVHSMAGLGNEQVKVKIIGSGVGGITETDVNQAITFKGAIIIGFNVRADAKARALAVSNGVELSYFSVIYEAIDYVNAVVEGLKEPEIREQIIGMADVREVFHSSKFGDVAGCIVSQGIVKISNPIRVLRDNVVIYEGELESLRRYKEDVNEVKSGTECGIGVKSYNNIRAGDQIEIFARIEIKAAHSS